MRLDKYLTLSFPTLETKTFPETEAKAETNLGKLSRKDVKKLIRAGRVTVDGTAASDPGMKVDEEKNVITLDGERVIYKKFVYLMLNKPVGYISATEDGRHKTVLDLVPDEYAHYGVFPVGRLDIDTVGLLILSNDGAFAHNMISPKKRVYKRYFARLSSPADDNDVKTFAAGMNLGDFTAMPAKLEITENPCEVYISVAEGKFHQVKRMCQKIGKPLTYLKRVSIGGLELDEDLREGEVREIDEDERDRIFVKCGNVPEGYYKT